MKILYFILSVTLLHSFTLPKSSVTATETNTTTLENKFFYDINNLSEHDIIATLQNDPSLLHHQFLYHQNLVHIAVASKKYQLLKYLSTTDISIYAQDSNGNTPLHLAIYKNDLGSIGILMKFKNFTKSLGIKNNRFLTPLELIKKGRNNQLKEIFLTKEKTVLFNKSSKQPPIEATIRIAN